MAATTASDASLPVAESNLPFRTSFLRDGASGKSFAIVQGNDSITSLNYTVYERTADAFGNKQFSGTVDGNIFSFLITKGSTYFIVARINECDDTSLHWVVDPNKRRLGVSGKKRSAESAAAGSDTAALKDAPAPEPAAPAAEIKKEAKDAAPKAKKAKTAAPVA